MTAMAEYIALIHKDLGSGFGASFPDFPGAISVASTLEELRSEAEEMLGLHIEGMLEDGEEIPCPSTLDAIAQLSDFQDAVAVVVVKAKQIPTPVVRINVTMPDAVLQRIDRYVAQHGLTRSGFLVHAAKKEMDAA